jgi:hypothetical protein
MIRAISCPQAPLPLDACPKHAPRIVPICVSPFPTGLGLLLGGYVQNAGSMSPRSGRKAMSVLSLSLFHRATTSAK